MEETRREFVPSNGAEVQHVSPNIAAHSHSLAVAPSIIGSSISNLSISIGGGPGSTFLLKAVNNNDGETQRDLAAACQQKLKAALTRRFSLLLEGASSDPQRTPLHRIYTEVFVREGGAGVNQEHEVRSLETTSRTTGTRDRWVRCSQLFAPADGPDQVRSVVTRGVAGIGKTVAVNKFVLDWAEDRDHAHLDFVFPLSFRELNLMREKTLSFEDLLAVFFPETKDSGIFRSGVGRMLFILDGLDESRLPLDFHECEITTAVTTQTTVAALLTNLIRGRLLPRALVWVTSRPLASSRIPPHHVDLVTEVRGFSDAQKDEYFRRKIPETALAERVIAHVKSCRSLHIMCHIPVFCWMAATVLERELSAAGGEDTPRSLTQMYIRFLSLHVDDIKSDPPLLRDHLMALGNLAFRELEQGHLIFYETDLERSGVKPAQASAFSGVYTQVFSEDTVLCREKMFSFVHLSIQEFFAALFVFLRFHNDDFNVLAERPALEAAPWRFSFRDPAELVLYREAVDKALRSHNGHYDIFLRFLLGLSLESNQNLLRHLMTHNRTQPRTRAGIIKHIKDKIKASPSPDRCLNLFHCLNELNDRSLLDEIQGFLGSAHLSASQWNALVVVLLASEQDLEEFELSQYACSEEGLLRLLPVVKAAQHAKLNACRLTLRCCGALSDAIAASRLRDLDLSDNQLTDAGVVALGRGLEAAPLHTLRLRGCGLTQDSSRVLASTISSGSTLRVLDLSDNDLRDAGVQQLCGGLESPRCELETLRLSLCGLTGLGCTFLAAALSSSGLKELDLSYNHPGPSGLELLSALLQDPQCRLQTLRVDQCGESRIKAAPLKYSTRLTLDPNTAHASLHLSEGNRRARRWTPLPYPDNPDRFDFWSQVLGVEGLTGRCYWEVDWSGPVFVGAAYRTLGRKGEGEDSRLGKNDSSWGVQCTADGFRAWHKGQSSALTVGPAPTRVGVFLDWTGGTLSFFTVAGGDLTPLHTFHATFREPLFPALRLGWADAAVLLC